MRRLTGQSSKTPVELHAGLICQNFLYFSVLAYTDYSSVFSVVSRVTVKCSAFCLFLFARTFCERVNDDNECQWRRQDLARRGAQNHVEIAQVTHI